MQKKFLDLDMSKEHANRKTIRRFLHENIYFREEKPLKERTKMNTNYTDIYNHYDGTSEAALKQCIDYANKEILAGTRDPAHIMYMAFEVYKRARLLEDKMRNISGEIYHQRLPKKMSYDFWQFIRLLDPKVKEICDEEYKNRSPYGPVVPKEW